MTATIAAAETTTMIVEGGGTGIARKDLREEAEAEVDREAGTTTEGIDVEIGSRPLRVVVQQ